jgi:hypothetical protein
VRLAQVNAWLSRTLLVELTKDFRGKNLSKLPELQESFRGKNLVKLAFQDDFAVLLYHV